MASDRDALAALIAEHFLEYVSGHCLCGIKAPNLTSWSTHVAEVMATAVMRPPAQVITDPTELDALPEQAVIVITGGAFQKFGSWWHCSGEIIPMHSEALLDLHEGAAATVLHIPTEEPTR